MIGLTAAQRAELFRGEGPAPERPRGRCRECRRLFYLRVDGRVPLHDHAAMACAGGRRNPTELTEQQG